MPHLQSPLHLLQPPTLLCPKKGNSEKCDNGEESEYTGEGCEDEAKVVWRELWFLE